MDDLPDVAHLFHWAVAAELLIVRGVRIMPGRWAEDLQRDPLSAWVQGIFAQLADLGAAERDDHTVRLTELGGALAAAASAVIDDDDELE